MIRIPYPIPSIPRVQLIAAGKEACAQLDGSLAKREAQSMVHKIIRDLTKHYGVECEK